MKANSFHYCPNCLEELDDDVLEAIIEAGEIADCPSCGASLIDDQGNTYYKKSLDNDADDAEKQALE